MAVLLRHKLRDVIAISTSRRLRPSAVGPPSPPSSRGCHLLRPQLSNPFLPAASVSSGRHALRTNIHQVGWGREGT